MPPTDHIHQAIGEYARQHSMLSAAMRTSEAPSPSTNSLREADSISGAHARSGSTAAPTSVIRIPVANAVSHLSGDVGGPSVPPLAPPLAPPRPVARRPSGAMVRIVSGAGYDEPSEVAEREGSAVEGAAEGSGDSPPRPAPTERRDITGLQTTISRVSTLHPTRAKAPKQAVVAAEAAGEGCECGCVSQPVVGKAQGVGKPVVPALAGEKCMQCGGVSRTAPTRACGHGKAACGEDKVVVDKQKLLQLLKELQGNAAVDVDTYLEALKP